MSFWISFCIFSLFQDRSPSDHGGLPVLVDARPGEDGGRLEDRHHLPGLRDGRQPGQRHLRAQQGRGRARRLPLWAAGLLHSGGDPPVAQPQVPGDGHPQAGRGHCCLLSVR